MLAGARLLDQLVALLVYQQLALDALEALPAQAPDAVLAEGTECALESITHIDEYLHIFILAHFALISSVVNKTKKELVPRYYYTTTYGNNIND